MKHRGRPPKKCKKCKLISCDCIGGKVLAKVEESASVCSVELEEERKKLAKVQAGKNAASNLTQSK